MEETPEAYHVEVMGPKGTTRTVSVVLPHEQLHLMALAGKVPRLRVSDASWNADFGVGKLVREWCRSEGFGSRDILALGIHADGVSYTTNNRAGYNRSVAVCSYNVISAESAADRGRRHLFYAVSKSSLCDCGCEGFHTVDQLNSVFGWSMQALARGQAPSCRHDGSPWTLLDRRTRRQGAIPVTAALLQCRGDWEWLVQSFRFRHYGSEAFCWMCDATHSGELSYLDVGPQARWRGTLLNHERYISGQINFLLSCRSCLRLVLRPLGSQVYWKEAGRSKGARPMAFATLERGLRHADETGGWPSGWPNRLRAH